MGEVGLGGVESSDFGGMGWKGKISWKIRS